MPACAQGSCKAVPTPHRHPTAHSTYGHFSHKPQGGISQWPSAALRPRRDAPKLSRPCGIWQQYTNAAKHPAANGQFPMCAARYGTGREEKRCISPTWHMPRPRAKVAMCGIIAISLNRPWRMPKPAHSRCFERTARRVYVDHNQGTHHHDTGYFAKNGTSTGPRSHFRRVGSP